ncbi:MAG: YecH family protein [Bacteroidia bacterium]|nr:YecH family protein [Bacteroidia bacterium]
MTHGHEVLDMMQGNSYNEASLIEAIKQKFGADERFYTCSAENLTAEELVSFLKEKGKFIPLNDGFTVNTANVCNH